MKARNRARVSEKPVYEAMIRPSQSGVFGPHRGTSKAVAILAVALAVASLSGVDAKFESSCGSSEQVAERLGQCLAPIFDILEGKMSNPKEDSDLQAGCERFHMGEKCVRATSKDCLKGLHKTATSSVASATRRFRNAECKSPASRKKYLDVLKCVNKKAPDTIRLFKNQTAMMQNVRDQNLEPEAKFGKICCLFIELDRQMAHEFDQECPKHTQSILNIVHALTDDARSTLCVSPKCQGALNGLSRSKLKTNQAYIEPIMQVLFMLNTD